MATPQQIETKLRAPRCLSNISFSARAQCPGTGTKSGRGLSPYKFPLYKQPAFTYNGYFIEFNVFQIGLVVPILNGQQDKGTSNDPTNLSLVLLKF